MNDQSMTKQPSAVNLTDTIKKLRAISSWFESQDEIDVEKGLEKVKEGATLISLGRARLKELENEFEELKKKLDEEA
jgi:hypothetical protein